ncbi:MAG: prenylated flavin chaperone LpdD [Coriobacteriia bacterium]
MDAWFAGHGVARTRVEAVIVSCGPDVSVCFGGGEGPHIGAVALAIPRPSLADPAAPSASASVLCVTGHKEDELARNAALEVATALGCRVSVSVGLHVDDATPADIREMAENHRIVLAQVIELLRDERGHGSEGEPHVG